MSRIVGRRGLGQEGWTWFVVEDQQGRRRPRPWVILSPFLLATALVLAVVLALLRAGDTSADSALSSGSQGQTSHFSFAGKGAQALWTTCPTEPQKIVCTFTAVFVADQVVKANGTRLPSTTLFLDQLTVQSDHKGNLFFVSESFGFADADLSVARQLSSASADATVPLTTCTIEHQSLSCVDGGTATVSGSWTGQGDLVRVSNTQHVVSKGTTLNVHLQGSFRDASAGGQVNGDAAGTQLFAQIFDVNLGEVFVCHGGC